MNEWWYCGLSVAVYFMCVAMFSHPAWNCPWWWGTVGG